MLNESSFLKNSIINIQSITFLAHTKCWATMVYKSKVIPALKEIEGKKKKKTNY